jgi:uncharacterized protein (TIGR04255 family)
MTGALFNFDMPEVFPRLAAPPIVEAMIHWSALPGQAYDLVSILDSLKQRFGRFVKVIPLQSLILQFNTMPTGDTTAARGQSQLGFRLLTEDGREAIQVFRDGFSYSLLKNYQDWTEFHDSALQAWDIYAEMFQPAEIQRIAVRFINHFPTATLGTLSGILRDPPTCPANLPLGEFVYQSTFDVPGYNYGSRIIKMMQKPTPAIASCSGLFLDIEVFTTKPTLPGAEEHHVVLRHLRQLKNKVFFALVQDAAIKAGS